MDKGIAVTTLSVGPGLDRKKKKKRKKGKENKGKEIKKSAKKKRARRKIREEVIFQENETGRKG